MTSCQMYKPCFFLSFFILSRAQSWWRASEVQDEMEPTCNTNNYECINDAVMLMQQKAHLVTRTAKGAPTIQSGGDWIVDASKYANTMTVSAIVKIGAAGGTLAAFSGSEVRGVQDTPSSPPFGPYAGKEIYQITIYGDTGGDAITFKFKSADGTITPLVETLSFVVNGNEGSVLNPIVFTASTPAPAPTTAAPATIQPAPAMVCVDAPADTVAVWAESEGYGPGRTCAEGKQYGLCITNVGMAEYCASTCDLCPTTTTTTTTIATTISACTDASADTVSTWAASQGYGSGRTCAEGKQYGLCTKEQGMKEYCAATCDFC